MDNIKTRVLFALLLSTILISIDFLTNLFFHNFYIESSKFTLQQIGITFVLSLLISLSKGGFRIAFSILLILLSTIEVLYFSFFRGLVQPYHFGVVWSEMEDILDSIYSIFPILILVLTLFIISTIAILRFSYSLKGGYRYANYALLTIFFTLPWVSHSFTISPMNFSYINMIYASSLALRSSLHSPQDDEFSPYKLEQLEGREQNVIFIMGESLSSKRMHLFGYERNNTPNLERLKGSPNFVYGKAISSGVNTPVSIVSFFTLKREPTNGATSNINPIRLANQNGYSTAWLSMQDEGMSISSILKYADHIKLRKDYPKGSYDEELLEDLKRVDWSGRNFIVLHFRANHSPYEKYIPPKFRVSEYNRLDYHKYKVDSYNDSVIYIDYLLKQIFNYMLSTKQEFKIYFTSDHGERLGYKDDNFKYGHSELDFEVAKVPFLIFSNRKLNVQNSPINHYQMGKMVLEDLGYRLINPNDDNCTYFINGLKRNGEAGFLSYRIQF